MSLIPNDLPSIRRPALLVSAARFGLSRYDRESTLRRLFADAVPSAGTETLLALAEREERFDVERRASLPGYSPAHHVEALIALISEWRLVMASISPHVPPTAEGHQEVPVPVC